MVAPPSLSSARSVKSALPDRPAVSAPVPSAHRVAPAPAMPLQMASEAAYSS
jgi:hypothetical protein